MFHFWIRPALVHNSKCATWHRIEFSHCSCLFLFISLCTIYFSSQSQQIFLFFLQSSSLVVIYFFFTCSFHFGTFVVMNSFFFSRVSTNTSSSSYSCFFLLVYAVLLSFQNGKLPNGNTRWKHTNIIYSVLLLSLSLYLCVFISGDIPEMSVTFFVKQISLINAVYLFSLSFPFISFTLSMQIHFVLIFCCCCRIFFFIFNYSVIIFTQKHTHTHAPVLFTVTFD